MLQNLPRFPQVAALTCRVRAILCFLACALAPLSTAAKDVPVTGVVIFGIPGSLAYAQVSGFLINGKTELRACASDGPIDKSAYKNLAKISLASVKVLERKSTGGLVAQIGEAPATCVVPGNFKWEKENSLTTAELAERSTYSGQVLGSSAAAQTALPPFAPGVEIVFGSGSDPELAEYLLAERAQTIGPWKTYLGKYPAGAHLAQARTGLAALLTAEGDAKLAAYRASTTSGKPDIDGLRGARERADDALDTLPSDPSALKLRDSVRAELKTLTDKGNAMLQAFHEGLAARKPGYPLLVAASELSARVSAADPKYPPGAALASAVTVETHALDQVVSAANTQVAAHDYDAAYATIQKYQSISGEEPRLNAIVKAAYKFHLDKGNAEVTNADWTNAVADLKKAEEIAPGSGAETALKTAEAGLLSAQNRLAADKAIAVSKQRVDDNDILGAYEILADLNDAQRPLVSEQMQALQDSYIQAAMLKAKELQSAHTPIRGRADEDGVRLAYVYLQRASKLSDNPEIGLKLDLVAEMISSYYVELAKKYLDRPLSSGVGVGWGYLMEASQYKANLDPVRDLMTTSNAAYQMRAKLSIGVLFRDQTSRRDSAGFADQLQQAFATGIETSGLPVKVVLPGSSGSLEPNFQFVGEILQHRPIRTIKKETLQSQYRSGTREVPNEAWNRADQEFEAANLNLQKAQGALAAAQTKNNKKQIEEANKELSQIQETVQAARAKMNAIPKTVGDDVVSPYNYTRTTLELTNIVDLSFRILDAAGNILGEPIRVVKGDQPKHFVILENIKPDDTKGLKEIDVMPDETQLMTDVEIEARDAMVKAARDRVQELPQKILATARNKAASNDLDGAAEQYVLYLNCTPAEPTKERVEAARFLSDSFNLRNTLTLRAAAR